MATDVGPRAGRGASQTPATRGAPRRAGGRRAATSGWWKYGLAVLVLAALPAAAAVLANIIASPPGGPSLTHAVTRGELLVTVTEQGTLESGENTEIKCKVRGRNTVIWVIENGTFVEPGDVLVRLDTLFIEEQINERTKYANWSRSSAEHSAARLARAELAVDEYSRGRYVTELMGLEKDLVVAEAALRSATNVLAHTRVMAESGYVSELEVEEKEFAVTQAALDVDVKKTEIDVLKRFTRNEELETLKGNLAAVTANHAANAERAIADASRRDRAVDELQHCVVRAERGGLVIHPSAARWQNAPEIAEGATVHKDQVLLLMPDLSKMQVKVGIHESVIDRMRPGLSARVMIRDRVLDGTISSVASVTRPAGWWTGNEVRYDTIVELPDGQGLWPGMTAEVELLLARHEDVLKIPVAAIVETESATYCWVETPQGFERRELELGDTNQIHTIVESGVEEGERVVLNPLDVQEVRSGTAAGPARGNPQTLSRAVDR